jgi:hypothetical protein
MREENGSDDKPDAFNDQLFTESFPAARTHRRGMPAPFDGATLF